MNEQMCYYYAIGHKRVDGNFDAVVIYDLIPLIKLIARFGIDLFMNQIKSIAVENNLKVIKSNEPFCITNLTPEKQHSNQCKVIKLSARDCTSEHQTKI